MASTIIVVGSLAFDSVETPFGIAEKILGGSANYFSLSASYFAPVRCVSVVGEDFPADHLTLLKQRGIDISGIEKAQGKTFHWSGKYGYDLNEAHTLATFLNVFEKFEPKVPTTYKDSKFVFLGNIVPKLQMKVLEQIKDPTWVAIDTMNFWIKSQREDLIQAISKCHALIINEAEIRELTETHNILKAANVVQKWGPRTVVIKRGEYGAVLIDQDKIFSLPGLPLHDVKDPTGAGDTFAGGLIGYLASLEPSDFSWTSLRRAVVFGSVMASFTVQDFGFRDLLRQNDSSIHERYQEFIRLTDFGGALN